MQHWTFSVSGEYLKLVSSQTGEVFFFLKRDTFFKPEDNGEEFIVNGLSLNIVKKIKRSECSVPTPNSDMTTFLDSLVTLASV